MASEHAPRLAPAECPGTSWARSPRKSTSVRHHSRPPPPPRATAAGWAIGSVTAMPLTGTAIAGPRFPRPCHHAPIKRPTAPVSRWYGLPTSTAFASCGPSRSGRSFGVLMRQLLNPARAPRAASSRLAGSSAQRRLAQSRIADRPPRARSDRNSALAGGASLRVSLARRTAPRAAHLCRSAGLGPRGSVADRLAHMAIVFFALEQKLPASRSARGSRFAALMMLTEAQTARNRDTVVRPEPFSKR